MIKQFEIDENEFLLLNSLQLCKQSLNFDNEIEEKLSNFIEYLEKRLNFDFENDSNIKEISLYRKIEFE